MPKHSDRTGATEKWYVHALPIALAAAAAGATLGLFYYVILGSIGRGGLSTIGLFAAAGFIGTYIVRGIVEFGGAAAGRVYGGSPFTAPPPDFSYADSLTARGAYREAVKAYDQAEIENPGSPEPTIRAARVLRDHLRRYDDALARFRRARAHPAIDEAAEALITREIAEIYINRMRQPARALPELARLADRFPDTTTGQWARRTLGELKSELLHEDREREDRERQDRERQDREREDR